MKLLIAAILSLFLNAVYAQTIQPGGGSATSIVGACGATNGQLLFDNSGACAGTIVTYNGGGNGTLTTGRLLGFSSNVNVEDVNSRVIMGAGSVLVWTSSSSLGTVDTGITRSQTPGVIDIGNGTAGNTAGGFVTANATLTSLTTGTNADFLCLAANGTILLQSSACTISSLRFKPDWKPYHDDAVAKVSQLDVGTFHLETGSNSDPNAASLQAGLSAESVAAIAPECAIYENDMKTPKSYRQECVIALLVKAVQQLKSTGK